MTDLRIAVFGAGLVGARHVETVAQNSQLAAVVDPNPKARELADRFAVPYFETPEACLDEMTPDGVIIATPNNLHADHALLCLDRSVPELVEKPIADTVENADRIVEASKRTSVPVLIGHHRRHNPHIARAKEIIESGALGDIVAVNGQFWLYKPDDYFTMGWRGKTGGGPLLINCIHDIDLLRHLIGEISEITIMRSSHVRGGTVEDTAAMIMRFQTGALGTFSLSDTVVAPWSWEMTSGENAIYPRTSESCYRLGGTHGSLSIPDMRVWEHKGQRSWWSDMTSETKPSDNYDTLTRQFEHFCDVIRGAAPKVSAQDGRETLKTILR